MKKVAFIINPVSGSGTGKDIKEKLSSLLLHSEVEATYIETVSKGHASQIAKEHRESDFDLIVACGGDGTVNEVASALISSGKPMGILPIGSGNGLARHYNIKTDPMCILETIRKGKVVGHDAAIINGLPGFNVSGIGFDAHVAHLFGKDGKRGFNSYLRLIAREFTEYKTFKVRLSNNNHELQSEAIMIPIAVASQFGNNAIIAPQADTNDGKTDITVVNKMHPLMVIPFAIRVFTKTISGSRFAKAYQSEDFQLRCETPQPLHVDGEPGGYHESFEIKSVKSAIQLAIP
ncbi:MAG: diacylglycerol/lipid kinase family protein [Arcticibacter sp.]